MGESEVKIERRRGDVWAKITSGLLTLMLAGLAWWMSMINAKAERVPILEERMNNLQSNVFEIKRGVEQLLERRR